MRDKETLHQVGAALFGPYWQTPLADALSVAVRTVQRWAAGDTAMPDSVWLDIAKLCKGRGKELERWAVRLSGNGGRK
jgi:hypothetical protein